jgi:hypothetical protein
MSNGKQSFIELAFITAELPKHDAILAQIIAKLNRLFGEAADAIERHKGFVEHRRREFYEMAKTINKSKEVVLDRLRSLGTIGGESDAFLKPDVARSLRHALLAGKRMLQAMKKQEEHAEELERELDRIIALRVRAGRSGI